MAGSTSDGTTGAAAQLAGVRVLDLGIWRPVPYAAQLLAELGADVTKVEPPGGDPMRAFPDLYDTLNRHKTVVELDLKSDAGQAALAPLLASADVMIEGFRPGAADRLGAGPSAAAAANPGVIYCSISGFGQDGPLSAASGHDLNYQAWAGALAGVPADGRPGLPVADLAGGTFATLAISASLARRGLTPAGEWAGERIDVSMADILLTWAGPESGGDLADASEPGAGFPAYGTFACADGALTLGIVTEDHFWRALCTEIGLGDLADLDAAARAGDGPAIRVRLAAAIAAQSRDELVARLLTQGVPVAPVLSRTEAMALEHFVARGTVVDGRIAHPVHFHPLR